jgi:serine/threonine-protein kinase
MLLLDDGQILRDTYEVERILGGGAFAEVCRVTHRVLGRQAMKVFKRVGMSLDDINEILGEAVLPPALAIQHCPRFRPELLT